MQAATPIPAITNPETLVITTGDIAVLLVY
jgi:hypothetical protein